MKKAVIGLAIVLLLTIAAFLLLPLKKTEDAAILRFVSYGIDTNGAKIANLSLTNRIGRPLHYFCRTLNDPQTIGYVLEQATGVQSAFVTVTNTLGSGGVSGRMAAFEEIHFYIAVPTNRPLRLSVPYFPQRDTISRIITDVRRLLSDDAPIIASSATIELPSNK